MPSSSTRSKPSPWAMRSLIPKASASETSGDGSRVTLASAMQMGYPPDKLAPDSRNLAVRAQADAPECADHRGHTATQLERRYLRFCAASVISRLFLPHTKVVRAAGSIVR